MTKIYYAIGSKKKTWTNQAGREALGIQNGETVTVTLGSRSVSVSVSKAPSAAARVMRAVTGLTGMHGIALTEHSRRELGIKPGDKVQVASHETASAVASAVPRTASSRTPIAVGGAGTSKPKTSGKAPTLRERMSQLPVGGILEVSEAAVKSSAYSVAKDLNIKIKKISDTSIKRVE